MASSADVTPYSVEHVLNQSFDKAAQVLVFEPVGFDGQNVSRSNADNLTIRVYNDGTYDYVATAAPGTTTSVANWQIIRVDGSDTVLYADGNANFDNVADNYASLTYL